RADRHVRLPCCRHGLVRQAELLHRRHEADRRHADPTPLLGNEEAEKTELAHLAEQISRAPLLRPRLRCAAGDLLLGEAAAKIDELPFRLAEGEVHGLILGGGCYERDSAPVGSRCAMKAADQTVRSPGT